MSRQRSRQWTHFAHSGCLIDFRIGAFDGGICLPSLDVLGVLAIAGLPCGIDGGVESADSWHVVPLVADVPVLVSLVVPIPQPPIPLRILPRRFEGGGGFVTQATDGVRTAAELVVLDN